MASPNPPAQLVFVYGTLRKGASNYLSMKGAERMGQAVIRGRLWKIGWVPVLEIDPLAKTLVRGDVFRVKDFPREAFYEYEGLAAGAVEGRDCRLIKTMVYSTPVSRQGWKVRLWEWTGPLDQAERVNSGDWLDVECPRSAPLFTLIAGACALALPACLVATVVARGDLRSALEITGFLAPVPGWVAIHLAGRRREQGDLLRSVVLRGLLFASVPSAIALVAMVGQLVERFS